MTSIRSPRIQRLVYALAHAESGAVDAFWAEVASSGAPLIEPVPGVQGESLVTFLHRGSEGAANVTLVSALTGLDFAASQFTLLPTTDLWYLTTQARDDLRTTYHIAVGDSLQPIAEETDLERRIAGWMVDALNPRRFTIPADDDIPGDQEYSASVVELPSAPAQPYGVSRDGIAKGEVTQFRLNSRILSNERRVWVYTPPNHASGTEPCTLVILFDAPTSLNVIPTPMIVDNLLAQGRIPPVVLVGIDSLSQQTRAVELMCHQPFADFLAHELLPWLHARYHISDDPADVVLAGQSAGGVAAAFAAMRYPTLFGGVLSQSGAFWWAPEHDAQPEWLTRAFADAPMVPLRFYMDAGLLETFAGPNAHGVDILAANRRLRDVLAAKGYSVTYAELHSGHDYIQWRGTMADGLLQLLGS